MRLTIFGATGGTGGEIVRQAALAGHQVTAVVRNPDKLSQEVTTFTADLETTDLAALKCALQGSEAVLSALGPRSASETGIVSQGTRAILGAMQAAGVRRIVAVSAAPISTVPSPDRPRPPRRDPGEGFFMRNFLSPVIKMVFRTQYADLALMEDILRASELDWTVVRPPRLIDKPWTGTYRTAYGQNVRRGLRVSRADLAHCMLELLDQPETITQTVGVAY